MKILVPVDIWQEDTNSHLAKDLERMLPVADANFVLLYAMQSAPHTEFATAYEMVASSAHGIATGVPQVDYSSDRFYDDLEKKAKKHLDDLAAQLRPLCSKLEIALEHGSPTKAIELVAQSKDIDLTVIRGSAAGLLEAAFLGNTVSQVIKHSHNTVLVLRSNVITTPLQKVIIALDGSQPAKKALRQFCQVYQPLKQKIEVVLAHVVSIPGPWRFISPVEFVATLEDNLDMAGKAILAEGETLLLECGWKPKNMPVPMIVRTGDPAVELDRLAAEVGAGLIVLGAQGKTAVENFLLGSVSEALALKSGFPILVFK